MKSVLIAMLLAACAVSAVAQSDVEIRAIQGAGRLTWSGCAAGTTGRVEWAAKLESGITQWNTFTNIVINGEVSSVEIPMAFRVVGTPSANWPTNMMWLGLDRNVALQSKGAVATASSEASYLDYTGYAWRAIDGLEDSGAWTASSLPAWLMITLPTTNEIYEVEVWTAYNTQTINIEASLNGTNWHTIVASTNLNPAAYGYDEFNGHNSRNVFQIQPMYRGRYVRLNVTSSTAPGGYIFKALIDEVKVRCRGM